MNFFMNLMALACFHLGTSATLDQSGTSVTTDTGSDGQPEGYAYPVKSSKDKSFEDNKCVCMVQMSSEHRDLLALKSGLANVQIRLDRLDQLDLERKIWNLDQRLTHLSSSLMNMSVELAVKELQDLQTLFDTLLELVEASSPSNLTAQLRDTIRILDDNFKVLWGRSPTARVLDLQNQMTSLHQQMQQYEQQTFAGLDMTFPGERNPSLSPPDQGWCSIYEIADIGEPTTHKYDGSKPHVWMKDPLPESAEAKHHIYSGPLIKENKWQYYRSYSDFISGKLTSNGSLGQQRRQHYSRSRQTLPPINWNAYIMYGGILYSSKSKEIAKFQFGADTTEKLKMVQMDMAGYNSYIQSGSEAPAVELMADELGLWAVYPTQNSGGPLAASRLNPESLSVQSFHLTSKPKSAVCASFMACGRLYTVDICTTNLHPGANVPQYLYNTTDNQSYYQPLFVRSKYGKLTHLLYNPRERMLFGVDNNHLVTYPIKWQQIKSKE